MIGGCLGTRLEDIGCLGVDEWAGSDAYSTHKCIQDGPLAFAGCRLPRGPAEKKGIDMYQ